MALDRPHARREFLAGGALTAMSLVGPASAQGQAGGAVFGAVVEKVVSPSALSVFVPDLGASRSLTLGTGVAAVHGRAGVVTSFEAFVPGEKVVFIPANGAVDGDEITVSELSSLVDAETIDVSRDGATVESSRGRFRKSAHLRTRVPKGKVEAVFWVDPGSGERYLCAANKS